MGPAPRWASSAWSWVPSASRRAAPRWSWYVATHDQHRAPGSPARVAPAPRRRLLAGVVARAGTRRTGGGARQPASRPIRPRDRCWRSRRGWLGSAFDETVSRRRPTVSRCSTPAGRVRRPRRQPRATTVLSGGPARRAWSEGTYVVSPGGWCRPTVTRSRVRSPSRSDEPSAVVTTAADARRVVRRHVCAVILERRPGHRLPRAVPGGGAGGLRGVAAARGCRGWTSCGRRLLGASRGRQRRSRRWPRLMQASAERRLPAGTRLRRPRWKAPAWSGRGRARPARAGHAGRGRPAAMAVGPSPDAGPLVGVRRNICDARERWWPSSRRRRSSGTRGPSRHSGWSSPPTSCTSPSEPSGWVAWPGWRSACRRSAARSRAAAETLGPLLERRGRACSPCWSASGSVLAWRIIGSWDDLFGTTYGRLLIVKVMIAALAVGDRRLGTGSRCCLACIGAADNARSGATAASAIRQHGHWPRPPCWSRCCSMTGFLVNQSAAPGAAGDRAEPDRRRRPGSLGEDLRVLGHPVAPGTRGTNTVTIQLQDLTGDPVEPTAATRPCGCGRRVSTSGDLVAVTSERRRHVSARRWCSPPPGPGGSR